MSSNSVCKPSLLCLVAVTFLLLLCHQWPADAVVSTLPTVCVGTQKSDYTTHNPVMLVKSMRDSLAGCQYVIGDIHIIKINEQDFINENVPFDMSFLDSIREITGCIRIIDSCFDTPISFKNLQVIRGRYCQDNIAIMVHYMHSCTLKIPPVDFRSLRYIGEGNVVVGGLRDCFIEKRVNYDELFADKANQRLDSKLPCLAKEATCHANCPVWHDGEQHCWGPGPDQCQERSKCRSVSGCPSSRCFVDSSGSEHCCSENCLGGCFGSTSKQCYGCTGFDKNGTCVSTCGPTKVYDNGIARLVEPREKFYPLGPVCVSQCPSSFFVEEDFCVSKCTIGYSPNSNKTCVKMLASKYCESGDSAMLCSSNNPLIVSRDNASQLCTEFTGHISIIDACFDNISHNGIRKLKVDDLSYIFSRLTVVHGNIYVTLTTPIITNLSFLANLQKIDRNPRKPGTGGLSVHSNFIQYLGLSSLRYVARDIIVFPYPVSELNNKGLGVHFCPYLFPKEQAVKDNVLTQLVTNPIFFNKIKSGFFTSLCPYKPETCHEECDPSYGCWGPFSDHCVKCLHMKAGSHCVSNCTAVNGWFNDAQTIPLSKAVIADQLCNRCSKLCTKCFGPDDNDCTDCVSSAYLDDSRCVDQCSTDNKYADTNRVCQSCPAFCLNPKNGAPTCTGNESFVGHGGCQFCTRVIPALKPDGGRILRCLSARQSCPIGFYAAVLDPTHVTEFPEFLNILKATALSVSVCLPCAAECLQCSGAAGFCSECRHFHIRSREDFSAHIGLKCTIDPQCPSGYFALEKERMCRPCSERCSMCSGPSDSDCFKCTERMYTYFPSEGNNNTEFTCVSSCPDSQPHAVARKGIGMTCSSNPASSITNKELVKGDRMTTLIVGIGISCLFLLFIFVVVPCYWFRQRNLHAKKRMRKRIVGVWDEDMEPLNVTDTAPNVAVLRTISEKEIVRGQEVGSGAFGTVFRGEWLPDGESSKVSVAIKILSDSLGDCNVSSELLEESRIMASVEHPHCVRLVGICMTQPLQLITQFMPLGNLRDFLRARKDTDQIGSSHLLRYAAQIAGGMSYLEQRSIIHRDLACRNVLVASTKCVKITDFGLAKLLDNPNDEYKASGGKLPVKWLALECLVSRKFSHKSDVWAYGVTLWEIFMFGDAPYVNVKPNDVADYLEKGERLPQPPICTLDVYILMIKCWMLNESQRPTFEDLETSFKKMAADPGRYVYIKGDKYARNPSNESGSTEHRSESSKSPSMNQLPSEPPAPIDADDCNYSALDATDMDNDVFRSEAMAAQASVASTSQSYGSSHNGGEHAGATSAAASGACSRQPKTYQKGGSQKYMNVKKAKLAAHNDNKYTSDPCKGQAEEHAMLPCSPLSQLMTSSVNSAAGPSNDDYLRPIRAGSSSASQDDVSLRSPPPPPPLPLCTSTVQNPEYFFNASRRQYRNVSSPLAQNGATGGASPPPPSPPPSLAHPMQLWVAAASRNSSVGSPTEDERNFSYV